MLRVLPTTASAPATAAPHRRATPSPTSIGSSRTGASQPRASTPAPLLLSPRGTTGAQALTTAPGTEPAPARPEAAT
ncbi:hypothetical protein ACOBQX_17165 [Actinokineospora sp. G85]|uniref:hypothetical protein n=1 Tax=Actinokineospora sp. G85 TaxID=3406626 RepID=UPI003C72A378